MATQLTDDGRTWYVCRAAVAAYRRDLTAAERADGRSVRHTRELLSASGLHAVAGPLTTPQAYELDLAMALADEATRWSTDEYTVPLENPMAAPGFQEMFRRIAPAKAARIRVHILTRYLPPDGAQ
jgi:hypothetical protein